MPWYKLTKGSLGLIIDGKGVDVEREQTIELPEEEAKKYRYLRLTAPLTVSKNELFDDSSQIETTRDWSDVLNMKAADLIVEVDKTTSVSDLEALYELEEKGQNRVTVLREIEKKVAMLEGGK